MNKEEFKKITEYLDKMVILHQTTGETINKDLDISIRLSVAYEELELENEKLKEVIDKAINELFILKDMIYKPETREENFEIQRKISSIIKRLNGKEVE